MSRYTIKSFFYCIELVAAFMAFFCLFQVMEDAMGSATTTTTPENQVEALMKQVAEENGLEITEQLASVPSATIGEATATATTATADDALGRRLAALRS